MMLDVIDHVEHRTLVLYSVYSVFLAGTTTFGIAGSVAPCVLMSVQGATV